MRKDAAVKRCLDAAFPRRRHAKWKMTQQQILTDVRTGTLFGMIECDVRVPEELRAHFAEMQPVFKNVNMTRDDLGPFMRRYAEDHDIMTRPRRMLVGSFRGDKMLLATPLLRWYLDHGLEVTLVYQVIEYEPNPCIRRFGDAVSTARREGDVLRAKHMTRGRPVCSRWSGLATGSWGCAAKHTIASDPPSRIARKV